MRVLTVGNMYPPHHFGGYELVWQGAVEHLRTLGHEVRVLTTSFRTATNIADPEDVHRELRWPFRNGTFPPQSLIQRWQLTRDNHATLLRHLDEMKPDVVAWWSMGGLSLTMIETVRRLDIPAVAFVHDEWLDYGRWADGWLQTFAGRRRSRVGPLAEVLTGLPTRVSFTDAAEFVFVSDFTRQQAHDCGLRLERTAVAHSGVHSDFLDPAPAHDWDWRILYVGRLDPRKGIETALRAHVLLPGHARLAIAGGWDNSEDRRLAQLADELGIGDRVDFLGQCSRDQILEQYAQADAVVFPVEWDEPWGLVPLEAMGRGRPVVATGRGGSGEYLTHEGNCLLFKAGDVEGLAAALKRLARDPNLRDRLRSHGLQSAASHTERAFNAAVEEAATRAAQRSLKVLHVGSGFRPMRHGGLVAYIEDLMRAQARDGVSVAYFFAGRYYPWRRRTRLLAWGRDGISMLEVVNSALVDHGYQPDLELSEPRIEALLSNVLTHVRPDVVHVHELAGLPSSVLDIVREAGVPTVMTLQDYFALCPAFKLYDATGQVCTRHQVGAECVATLAREDRSPALMADATLRYSLQQSAWLKRLPRQEGAVSRITEALAAVGRRRRRFAQPDAYQRRRDVNVARLNRVDRLVAMSSRVRELYVQLGVEPNRIVTDQLTLAHIEHLKPRRSVEHRPVVFATLGGGESEAKGARVLLDAAAMLADLAASGRLRVILFGYVAPAFAELAANIEGVDLGGSYTPRDQDERLAEVDVGIVPSVWEEAYGYAGIELLAMGIPVIANAIGGMVDYVIEGESGWLNRSCTAAGLAQIMRSIIETPDQVVDLNERLRESRSRLIVPMDQHVARTAVHYRSVMNGGSDVP